MLGVGNEINDLSTSLYSAVLDGEPLQPILAAITQACGGVSAMTQVVHGPAPGTPAHGRSLLVETVNLDPALTTQYETRWAAHDPWLQAILTQPSGQLVEFDRLVAPRDLLRSPIWDELKPEALHCVGTMYRGPGEVTAFGFHRTRRQGPFTRDHVARAAHLAPHIRRALGGLLRLRRAGLPEAPRGGHLADSLAEVALPLATLDRRGRVTFANPAFEALRAAEPALAVAAGGILHLAHPGAAARLAAALAAGEGADIALPRPAGPPLRLVLAPSRGRGTLLQVIVPPRVETPAAILARRHGLTAAEAALLGAVLAGRGLRDHAAARGVSIHTVRAQMKSVLAKVGVRRQAELFLAAQRASA